MGRYTDILDALVHWARLEDSVRAAIIVGSQARTYEPADEWSDLDAALIVRDPQVFIDSATWLDHFGRVVCTFNTASVSIPLWIRILCA
jgi:aminoglycoside 6-adenylyltransferase